MLLRKVQIVDRDHTWNGALARQYPHLLPLKKLIPERMSDSRSSAMQPNISVIGYLAHDESRVIESARHETKRASTAHRHDQITEIVAPPAAVRGNYRVGDTGFVSRRRLECEP